MSPPPFLSGLKSFQPLGVMTPTIYDGILTSIVGLLSEEPEGSCDDDSSDSEIPGLLSGSVISWRRRAF